MILQGVAIFVTLALLVMWLTAVSNFRHFPKLQQASPPLNPPFLSILIPARNEEAVIARTVRAILMQTVQDFELIILDDQSDDDTQTQIWQTVRSDVRVQVVDGRPLPDGWLGKNWACHQLAQLAKGELLLFFDADVQLAPSALASLLMMQHRTQADLLTIWPTQQTQTWAERLVVPLLGFAILSYLPIWPVHHSRLAPFAAANGQCLLFTQNGYTQCGGHTAVKQNIVEDVALAKRIKQAGLRLWMADGNRLIGCRMYHNWSEVEAGFAKNILAGHGNSTLFLMLSTLFHWLIFLFPWLWLVAGGGWWAVGLIILGIGLRWTTAVFTLQRPRDALLMPLSILLMTRIAMRSVRWHLSGTTSWKGRVVE